MLAPSGIAPHELLLTSMHIWGQIRQHLNPCRSLPSCQAGGFELSCSMPAHPTCPLPTYPTPPQPSLRLPTTPPTRTPAGCHDPGPYTLHPYLTERTPCTLHPKHACPAPAGCQDTGRDHPAGPGVFFAGGEEGRAGVCVLCACIACLFVRACVHA